MNSPFPGMNPWLEGYIWPDVHQELASAIRFLLAPQIAPKYVARIAIATISDNEPESEIGITYPDVEVLHRKNIVSEPAVAYGGKIPTEPTVIAPFKTPISVRIPSVEIRDTEKNKLVTAIEILSPVNKRNPNLIDYRKKTTDLHRSGVHVLELDLLRRGTRPFVYIKTNSHYQMMLLRAKSHQAGFWEINIQDDLPILPVPLISPDPDVLLDLRTAIDIIFERGLYHLSLDYSKEPPPPEFSEKDKTWIHQIVKK